MTLHSFKHKFCIGGFSVFMKKSLLGLSVALAALAFGVLSVNIFLVEEETISGYVIEELFFLEPKKENSSPSEVVELNQMQETEDIEPTKPEYFSGWYSLEGYGEKMPEVQMISLSGEFSDKQGNQTKNMVGSAGVFTTFENYGDQGFVEDSWAKTDGKTFQFKTKKIKGIEYKFDGYFLKKPDLVKEDEKVLRGTLEKYIKGKKIAQIKGDFAYSEPQCWH